MVERGGVVARLPVRNVLFKSRTYDGVSNGLAFGFGGTSVLWGGQLLPMLESELAALGAPWHEAEFAESLRKHYRTIENWVGVASSPFTGALLSKINHHARQLNWGSITPTLSKWIPFRRRNLGAAWKGALQRSGKVRVYLNLQPVDWGFDSENRNMIRSVTCRSRNGSIVRFDAHHFVIAAGALESPLIVQNLLGVDIANQLGVGQYLHDHLSLRIAELVDYRRVEFEKLFTPFFTGSTMRSLRLCLPHGLSSSLVPLGWAYCHFVIEAPPKSGFAVARDFLRGVQASDYPKAAKTLLNVPSAVTDIVRMIWLRYVYRRLSLSKGSKIFINVDFVQSPSAGNMIRSRSDGISGDQIELDWRIDDDIEEQINRALSAILHFWQDNLLNRVGVIEPISYGSNGETALSNIYDIFHPAGTCAMGRVVDADLKIFGVTNGYVIGSSVFPRLGRSNPTLTIMALSLRLGELIAHSLEERQSDELD